MKTGTKAEVATPETWTISSIPGDNHVMAGQKTIAIVTGWPGVTPEDVEANKRLIAAAPALLAELQQFIRRLKDGDIIDLESYKTDGARAAIAAATGGQS